MVHCSQCRPPREMPILTLEQTPDYTVGWQCDDCAFRSTVNSELPRSRQRFHCVECSEDVCILCGRKRAQASGGVIPQIPELSMTPTVPRSEPDELAALSSSCDDRILNKSHSLDGSSSDEENGNHNGRRRTETEDDELSQSLPVRPQRRSTSSWSQRVRKDDESSHAAWFSAAKKQWLEGGMAEADVASPKKGSRTIVEVPEIDDEVASIPTSVEVDVPSYSKAPAGHVVYTVKVYDKGSSDNWTVLKRYSEFRALYKLVRRGFKYSKCPDDLKGLLPFPKKTSFPDLKLRRQQLDAWLKDLVSKVSMHVCDDTAARQASLFLGLKASAYLDVPEERRSPSPEVDSRPLPTFRLPSHGAEVMVTAEVGKGSANLDKLGQSAAVPISDERGSPASVAGTPNKAPAETSGTASRTTSEASGVSSVRLFEALALYEEGLIGETDLIFARKGILDEIIQSDKPPVNKLRDASALLKQSLITQAEYDNVKREVLVNPKSALNGLVSGRSSPHSSEYGSVSSQPR